MAKVASSGAEEALATIDVQPKRNVKKSEAFVMSGDRLISLNRNVSSTYAKLLGDQLPPTTTVASSTPPQQLSRAAASAGVAFPSMQRSGSQKASRLPVSMSQIDNMRKANHQRKSSEESPTAIRMLKTAPIERMESTDVEEDSDVSAAAEKENEKVEERTDLEEQLIVEHEEMKSPNEEIVNKSLRSAMFTMPPTSSSFNSSPHISTGSPLVNRANGDFPHSPVYDDVDELDGSDLQNKSDTFRSPEGDKYYDKDTPSKHSVVTIDAPHSLYETDDMSRAYYSTVDTTPKHSTPSLRKQVFGKTPQYTQPTSSSASGSPSLHATSETGTEHTGGSIRSDTNSAFAVNQVASTSMNSVGGEREAAQIARRLYELKTCTATDVADRLNEQNDFSFLILVKYLELFQFSTTRIDAALREFLCRVELRGESSARERLLRVFSARYLECNPSIFESLDEVHTLTCALLLLNSDLHGPNTGKKMSARDFITNIGHTGCTYKRDMLKTLYQSIKDNAIALQSSTKSSTANGSAASSMKQQQIYEVNPDSVVEYYSAFLLRKYVREADGGKTPFGRRSWKMMYARLRGLVLYFDSDEHPKATSRYASLENAVSLHHALAEPAPDYKKKSYVFRVRIAHGGELLFQTSNEREVKEWCDKINFVAAAFSSPTLPLPVTSKPESAPMPRLPRIPCLAPISKQIRTHESRVTELNEMIDIVAASVYPERPQQQILDRLVLLYFEKRRYSTYIKILRAQHEDRKASNATMNVVMSPKRTQKTSTVCEDRLSYTDAVNNHN